MTEPCNWASIANGDDPCYGDVSLVEFTDMATGDRVAVPACEGHRRMVKLGFYLGQGEPDPEDTNPDAEIPPMSDPDDSGGYL